MPILRRCAFPWCRHAGLLLLGWSVLVDVALAADPSFPRGIGFYFHPVKLALLVLSFLGWVKICSWVDDDAVRVKMDFQLWNCLPLGAGLIGFLLLWNIPSFFLSFILFWAFVGGSTYYYVITRNEKVQDEAKLLTPEHFQRIWEQGLAGLFKRKKTVQMVERGIPIRFITRSTSLQNSDDPERGKRVMQSKGYKKALEMVWEAIQKRSTDIHMEPAKEEMSVRFRIDGVMTNQDPFSRQMGDAVINLMKVIANLDITEKRKAQDGGFSAQVEDRTVEFRVATAGSVLGEKMVVRILDSGHQVIDLEHVGMPDDVREKVKDIATKPHGMFLVCGPTGSGKSTTLYACLHEIDRFTSNVITIENPVEYRLDNVTQIEINPKAGKTFATELRSILRQDPDVIMVGEIRDKETAEIGCQAAQTGHMVFSTVHANDTLTSILRLVDLGVQPFMISSALVGVLGQRLVRKLCPKCRKRYKPTADTLKKLRVSAEELRVLYRPPDPGENVDTKGEEVVCEHCGGTGYRGRTGVYELLVVSDTIKDLIRENPNMAAIKAEAIKLGWRPLFDDGLRLVMEGTTSVAELLRVCK